MGKTRNLFKKIRYQENISCKDGLDKGQKWYGPNKQNILRRHGKNSQKNCTKKIFMTQINMMVLITHLEADFLECKIKWALGRITRNKSNGGDGISVGLFQILKDNAVKVLHSICQHIWKTQQWPHYWKRSVFIPIPKKGNAKEC